MLNRASISWSLAAVFCFVVGATTAAASDDPQRVTSGHSGQDDSNCVRADVGEGGADHTHPASNDCAVSPGDAGPRLVVKPLLRVRNLSVEQFEERYSTPERTAPLIFEGLASASDGAAGMYGGHAADFDPSDWTRPKLRELCGDVPLKITTFAGEYIEGCGDDEAGGSGRERRCHHVRVVDPQLEGKAWAGLGPADLGGLDLSTMADLLDRQDADEDEGRSLYLHDAPLLHYCPAAMDLLPGVPKYFRRDYNVLDSYSVLADMPADEENFWDEYKGLKHFPSLFVGKGGGTTGSPLHSDVGLTRFWKLQLSGRKQWRVVAPDDRDRLSPAHPSAPRGSMAATMYRADLFDPDFVAHPHLDGLVVYEAVTEPGDVIYLPESWPHQVHNLEDSVSVAYNFIDNHNLAAAAQVHSRNLREAGKVESGNYLSCLWGSFFVPLDDPPPLPPPGRSPAEGGEHPMDDGERNFVPFRTFFRDQNVRLMTDVPSSARRLAEESAERGEARIAAAVGAHRDSCGRPPLHAAASYGHIPLMKYLLDEVGVDPGLRDDHGWAALEVLEELMRTPDSPAAVLLRLRLGNN